MLLLKTVAVAAMVFVGLTARQVAQARLARASDLTAPIADRLRRAFGTEAVIGVVVIGLSGWMLSLTPGKVPDDDDVDYAVDETIVDPTSGLDARRVARPRAGSGSTSCASRCASRRPGSPGSSSTFIPPDGLRRGGIVQTVPLTGAGIAVSRRRLTCRSTSPAPGRCR